MLQIIVCEGSLHRRNRFILACSLGLGLGVTLVPQWAYNALWPVTPGMNDGLKVGGGVQHLNCVLGHQSVV